MQWNWFVCGSNNYSLNCGYAGACNLCARTIQFHRSKQNDERMTIISILGHRAHEEEYMTKNK